MSPGIPGLKGDPGPNGEPGQPEFDPRIVRQMFHFRKEKFSRTISALLSLLVYEILRFLFLLELLLRAGSRADSPLFHVHVRSLGIKPKTSAVLPLPQNSGPAGPPGDQGPGAKGEKGEAGTAGDPRQS